MILLHSITEASALGGALREFKRDLLKGIIITVHQTQLNRLVGWCYDGMGSFLKFHSVVKNIDKQLGQSAHVQDDTLREIVRHLQTTGRDIVKLD
jgi:hypothetical protein